MCCLTTNCLKAWALHVRQGFWYISSFVPPIAILEGWSSSVIIRTEWQHLAVQWIRMWRGSEGQQFILEGNMFVAGSWPGHRPYMNVMSSACRGSVAIWVWCRCFISVSLYCNLFGFPDRVERGQRTLLGKPSR